MLQLLNHSLYSIVYLILSVSVAAFLLWKGFRSKRFGDVPHCEQCGYNLTGLQSDQCPECGVKLTDGWATFAVRRRRPVLIVLGCMFLLFSSILAYGLIQQVDWITVVPTRWLISELDGTDAEYSSTVFTELERRYIAGEMTAKQISRFTDSCLDIQKQSDELWQARPLVMAVLDQLGVVYLAKQMTTDQKAVFFDQMIDISLDVRKKVIKGDPVPKKLFVSSHLPSSPWWLKIERLSASVDGDELDKFFVRHKGNDLEKSPFSTTFDSLSAPGTMHRIFAYSTPGKHTYTETYRARIYYGPKHNQTSSSLFHDKNIQLSKDFEVVDDESHNTIHMIDDPSLFETLKEKTKAIQFRYTFIEPVEIEGYVEFERLPVNIAFDVLVRIGNHEEVIGDCIKKKNGYSDTHAFGLSWRCDSTDIESIDIILRSNEDLVRQSVDMYEAWDGELVLENVPVSGGYPDPEENVNTNSLIPGIKGKQ